MVAVERSSVQWGAVLAGASLATATGLILLAFGAALGLTVTSPYEGEGLSPAAFAIAAGLYFLWVQVMSFYVGGYVTGRLRIRAPEASEHETDVQDGLHGLVGWAVGVVAAAVIAFAGVGGIGSASQAPDTQVATSVARVVDEQVNEAAAAEQPSSPVDTSAADRRAEIVRKLAVISAFITAASLLVGAIAAFYGAHSGGNHRDKNVTWPFFTSYVRTARATPKGPTAT
jgi:hypothetical protein